MPRYQIEISVSADGCVEVEAASAAEARKLVKATEPEIHFPDSKMPEGFDASLFDPFADLRIQRVTEMEDE